MKQIPLTQGKFALVDDEDYPHLILYKWHAHRHRNTFYARRNVWVGGKCITIRMHETIVDRKENCVIDHVNGNGLDNRRENLRVVTVRQNNQNLHISKSSNFPGVCWDKNRHKWISFIKIRGRRKYLGRFTHEIDAFNAYKNAVERLTGESVLQSGMSDEEFEALLL